LNPMRKMKTIRKDPIERKWNLIIKRKLIYPRIQLQYFGLVLI